MGDDIQAIKAGILEIADILVVNKADRPGVENTLKALRNALELAHPVRHVFQHHGQVQVGDIPDLPAYNSWIPPIQKTISLDGTGIPELAAEIDRHKNHLHQSGDWAARERSRLEAEINALIQGALVARFRQDISQKLYEETLEKVIQRELAPWEAVKSLLNGSAK